MYSESTLAAIVDTMMSSALIPKLNTPNTVAGISAMITYAIIRCVSSFALTCGEEVTLGIFFSSVSLTSLTSLLVLCCRSSFLLVCKYLLFHRLDILGEWTSRRAAVAAASALHALQAIPFLELFLLAMLRIISKP